MPIFRVKGARAEQLKASTGFPKLEKGLQSFVETNLPTLFGVRFVASEHSTGGKHHGRIDTLGIDEDGSPVVIEYKHLENENVINQGLFYLDWLTDHRGDFERLAEKKLGGAVHFDWSAPRLILLAQSFNRYDQYAVNRISDRIELWTYTVYSDGVMALTRLNQAEDGSPSARAKTKSSPTHTASPDQYDFAHHKAKMAKETLALYTKLREEILGLATSTRVVYENHRAIL